MPRFKNLVGATLLLLTLFVLTLSFNRPVPDTKSQKADLSINQDQPVIDYRQVELYKLNQQKLKEAVEAYFQQAIASGDIVGAGVSIVKKDSIVISQGFGKRKIQGKDKVNEETLFRLGSLSKGFAGVLAASVKSEGKLDWTDRVSDYLPEFQLGDRSNTHEITLANILSHTSGTPYHSFTNLVEAGLPLEEITKRFKEVVPISKPGLIYSYQNAMFALCGEMIRKVTGQNIAQSLESRLFKPLGMCTTTLEYETLASAENVAFPHARRRNGWRTLPLTDRYQNAILAGGINASAHDMAKWMRFLLGHNPELMTKTSLNEVFNPFIEIKGHNKYYHRWPGHVRSYYGFGWRIHKFTEDNDQNEKTIWHHGGSVNNFRNEIAVYPEADLGICVLLNSNSKIAKTVIPDVHKIVKDVYGQSSSLLAQNNSLETFPSSK